MAGSSSSNATFLFLLADGGSIRRNGSFSPTVYEMLERGTTSRGASSPRA
jgi:hypothetical protein